MSDRTPRASRARRLTGVALAGGLVAAGAGATPASAATSMQVELISIYCERTEDWLGADEPYLLFNGQRVWGNASLNDRESEEIRLTLETSGAAWVQLYDEDAGWFDDDDALGLVLITEEHIGAGVQQGRFTGDGADYTLYYRVS